MSLPRERFIALHAREHHDIERCIDTAIERVWHLTVTCMRLPSLTLALTQSASSSVEYMAFETLQVVDRAVAFLSSIHDPYGGCLLALTEFKTSLDSYVHDSRHNRQEIQMHYDTDTGWIDAHRNLLICALCVCRCASYIVDCLDVTDGVEAFYALWQQLEHSDGRTRVSACISLLAYLYRCLYIYQRDYVYSASSGHISPLVPADNERLSTHCILLSQRLITIFTTLIDGSSVPPAEQFGAGVPSYAST
jgi:hypothetical protein